MGGKRKAFSKSRAALASGVSLSAALMCVNAQGQGLSGGEGGAPSEIYLQADTFINDTDQGRYIARGNVEALTDGRILRADEILYYPETDRIVVNGRVQIIEPDGTIDFADSADLSDEMRDGVITGFASRMPNGSTTAAAFVERRGGTQNLLTRAVYSACPVCEESPTPTWRLQARKALQDTDDEMIYYRDVFFQLKGIPIFYSPFFAHADPSVERKTGFLLPSLGYSTLTGAEYVQPYFWAIDEFEDLTVSPKIMTGVSPLVDVEFRRRLYSGTLEVTGHVTHEQNFDRFGEKFGDDQLRGAVFARGLFAIEDDWAWGFGVERATDAQFLNRYSIYNYEQHGLYQNEGYSLLTQLFTVKQDVDFYASAAAVEFQSIYLGDSDRLPRLLPITELRRTFDLDEFGRFEMLADTAYLQREDGLEYLRATSWLDWKGQYRSAPGIVVDGFARTRGDIYHIAEAFDPFTGAQKDGSADRFSGFAGIDARWPFYRPSKIDLIFEPRVSVSAGFGDRNALDKFSREFVAGAPVPLQEDSLITELNTANIFSPSIYPGFDLVDNGLRASVGATVTADWPKLGDASVFVGRSFRTNAEDFGLSSGLDTSASDYVVAGTINTWLLYSTLRLRIDPDEFNVERLEYDLKFDWGPFFIQSSYYNFAPDVTGRIGQEYVRAYGEAALTDNVVLGMSFDRDLESRTTISHSYELTYRDDCFSATLAFVDYNRQGTAVGPSQAIVFNFSLATLGRFGTDTRQLIDYSRR